MKEYAIKTEELKARIPDLKAGDRVLLSGTIFTARDAAHMELFRLLDSGEPLPFPIAGSIIYYAGPTPTQTNGQIGSFGPTTASRMDKFAPRLLDLGIVGMIGKGGRSEGVRESIIRNGAVYLCAIGGAGALAAKSIAACEEIAFHALGCESVKRLTVENFPLIVGIDSRGGSLFDA
jgi:fumarate hydratase subunit beta